MATHSLIPIMNNIDNSVRDAMKGKQKWITVRVGGKGMEGSPLTLDSKSTTETESFEDMVASLPQDDTRAILYHLTYEVEVSGGSRISKNKTVLISWVPIDNLNGFKGVKARMLSTAVAKGLKEEFHLQTALTARDMSELTLAELLEKASKFERDSVIVESAN